MVDWQGWAQQGLRNQQLNDPLTRFSEGFQIGALIRQQRALAEQREAQARKVQQESMLQQQMQNDFNAVYEMTDPQAQAQTLAKLSLKYPNMAETLNKQSSALKTEVKENLVNKLMPAYSALLNGKKDIALPQIRTLAESFKNSGDEANFERFNSFADSLEQSDDYRQQLITANLYLQGIMGVDKFNDVVEKLPKTVSEFTAMPFEQAKTESEAARAKSEADISQEKALSQPFETQKIIAESIIKGNEAKSSPEKIRLDLELKRSQIAAQRASEARAYQGITESQARIDKLNKVQQPTNGAIVDLGLPTPARVPWANLTDEKQKNMLMSSVYKTSEKELNKRLTSVQDLQSAAQDVDRFIELNKKIPTGGFIDRTMIGRGVGGLTNAEYDEMRSISAKLAPRMRPEGAGATSDYDAKQYERATVGVDKSGNANLSIAKAIKARAQNATEYQDYLQNYLTQNGTLADADRYWKEYSNKNPILDPKKPNTFEINKNRVPWELYFSIKKEKEARGLK